MSYSFVKIKYEYVLTYEFLPYYDNYVMWCILYSKSIWWNIKWQFDNKHLY